MANGEQVKLTYQDKNLDSDGFEGSHFLGSVVGVLDSELEGSLSVVENGMPLSYRQLAPEHWSP